METEQCGGKRIVPSIRKPAYRGTLPPANQEYVLSVIDDIELLKNNDLKVNEFASVLKEAKDVDIEIGVWLEMPQPLLEDVGLPRRGRPGFTWDSHVNVGFLMGYTTDERKLLIDQIMRSVI